MNWKILSTLLLLLGLHCQVVQAAPRLAFSDLVNGPVQGLSDGLGQGAIVTVWGYQLGETPGQVIFEDSTGLQKPAAYLYYWKKADGKLPGGPANLYKSHQLFEVAFSLPTATLGTGKIILQHHDGSQSNPLPFTAIAGRIFHIKANGNNLNDGSFNNPWKFMNADDSRVPSAGNGKLLAGDLVYFHGTTERLGDYEGSGARAAIFLRSLYGNANAHIGMLSYPGAHTLVESPTWGIHPYLSTGLLISKFIVKGGIIDDPKDFSATIAPTSPSTAQITTTANGRIIANSLTDIDGKCSNGYAGAITGGSTNADNVSILGNEIYGIGCWQTSHFHHTTYMTRRTQTGAAPIAAGEFAWNYLHDNMAKFGVHYYDQNNSSNRSCDQVTGTLRIHNNYILNQRSAAISVQTQNSFAGLPCWQMDTEIYNNIIHKVGLGPIAELTNGTQPYALILGGGIEGKFSVFNNLFVGISDESARRYDSPAVIKFKSATPSTTLLMVNNIVRPDFSMPTIIGDDAQVRGNLITPEPSNSLFQRLFGQKLTATEQLNYFSNPSIHIGDVVIIAATSPAIGKGILLPQVRHDFYGKPLNIQSPTIGPIQHVSSSGN